MYNRNIINIETTNICPAHCVICPRDEYKQKKQSMNIDLYKKIIDDAAQYSIETLDTCGFGDPFYDKYLEERLVYAKKKIPNIKTYVSSTMFNVALWDVFKYIDILKISFYGMNPSVYKKMHNLPGQDALITILDIRESCLYQPYMIGLFVETEINKHETQEWINFWEPRLNEVFVWKPHNWVDYRNYRPMKVEKRTCGRPLNGPLYIHVDGTVSPCCWDINKRLKIGDMNIQTIGEVMKSDEFKKIQEAHLSNNFEDLICNNCDQVNDNPDSLIYSTNKNRKIGQLTPNMKEL